MAQQSTCVPAYLYAAEKPRLNFGSHRTVEPRYFLGMQEVSRNHVISIKSHQRAVTYAFVVDVAELGQTDDGKAGPTRRVEVMSTGDDF